MLLWRIFVVCRNRLPVSVYIAAGRGRFQKILYFGFEPVCNCVFVVCVCNFSKKGGCFTKKNSEKRIGIGTKCRNFISWWDTRPKTTDYSFHFTEFQSRSYKRVIISHTNENSKVERAESFKNFLFSSQCVSSRWKERTYQRSSWRSLSLLKRVSAFPLRVKVVSLLLVLWIIARFKK